MKVDWLESRFRIHVLESGSWMKWGKERSEDKVQRIRIQILSQDRRRNFRKNLDFDLGGVRRKLDLEV